jgi:uncharacterized protein DUF1553/uncharacterized protein DUF1549/cytochrome c
LQIHFGSADMMRIWTTFHGIFGLLTWVAFVTPLHGQDRVGEEFFEKRIRPILAENCFSCHGPKKQKAGLRLDNPDSYFKGGESGAVVVKGQPERSLLIQAVRQTGDLKMPPKGKLSDQAIGDLITWIKSGSPWPRQSAVANSVPHEKHWAFQPVRLPSPPRVNDVTWPISAIDQFILAEMEKKGLRPSAPADRRTLIRRITYDLIGLPPTAEEITAFEADRSAGAVTRLVDRLLSSPQYGERWGRYWLDVARYADTKGYVFTQERRFPFSYTYRDYVIRSFNDDLPFDQFIVQQLAADQLFARGAADKQALAAMGFLTLGRRFLNNKHDIIDDRIDVVCRGFLGLTVTCARCHDHKYDPIPSKDYYSLYGVFASSLEPDELPLIAEPDRSETYAAYEKRLKTLQNEVNKYREANKREISAGNRKFRDGLRALQRKVDAWQASSPAAPARAMVLVDASQPIEPHVFLRGNPNRIGPAVPRQFLAALAGENRRPFHEGSGRLELARAIASKDNPLTARVLVNRLWLHHFGAPLVRTPSDFGLRSEKPTHPDLLDNLAWQFVNDGWSIKKMHRRIILSATYQQSSADNPTATAIDPENRLLWRYNRRRLDFEAMRDSLLAVCENLNWRMGGRAVDITTAPFQGRRSIYGFIDRQNLPGLFRTFDFASPDSSSPQRYQTTVPQQALFFLNSPFILAQTRSLLRRPEVLQAVAPEKRISILHRLIYARSPAEDEIRLGKNFLATAGEPTEQGLSAWERYGQVLLLANEFMFVD